MTNTTLAIGGDIEALSAVSRGSLGSRDGQISAGTDHRAAVLCMFLSNLVE